MQNPRYEILSRLTAMLTTRTRPPRASTRAPDAMIIIDSRGEIVFANRQVENPVRLPGGGTRSVEEDGAAAAGALPTPPHRPPHRLLREHPRAAHGLGLDLFARRRDGSEFPVEISLSPAATGGETLAVAAIRDITERREIQNALRAGARRSRSRQSGEEPLPRDREP